MAVDHQARQRLRARLRDVLGDDEAETLVEELDALAHRQAATRADLQATESRLRGELADLRGEFADLRGEFGDLRGEFGLLRADVAERLEVHTRTMLVAMIGAMATIAGIAFGAAGLG